ncbi:L-fucose dehydrogenase [Pedobacter sp. KBW06]|uniref:aldo/keto reductase n=1 Tax=Pedobacter sp. KBW06 TaxID=2153359 RepID=UPI000F5B7C6C|nr:aldo/keto reductase [Pedobacter sp. KBW06]RQO65303.1 L-fucose dehydrogenase [Pedobacter sp. KBW06]
MANIKIPAVVFGTSGLGNLYHAPDDGQKKAIVNACLTSSAGLTFFDTAGKYGAGLALEVLGSCLKDLRIDPSKVLISNKLGWYQTELKGPDPTFEPGVWKNLKNDALQRISYQGILDCFEQGNQLLGDYPASFVSVHDPDEYLRSAKNERQSRQRYADIIGAYQALHELKSAGRVAAVGIGAKDWKVIRKIEQDVHLDWVMIANSLTVKSHPKELIQFIEALDQKNIPVINSAIFNGGFLTGSEFYNYRQIDDDNADDQALLTWRNEFFDICSQYGLLPAEACFNFCSHFSGIKSIAMSTTKAEKVAQNLAMTSKQVPPEFWTTMYQQGLIETPIIS